MMKLLDTRFAGAGLLLLGVLAVLSVYLPGLHGGFFFDDNPNIVLNPRVKVPDLSWESLRMAWSGGLAGQFGRPVSQVSFAINYHFSGFDAHAFKLGNLAIHCMNGVLVYLLACQVLDSLRSRLQSRHFGLHAALLASAWLLHPVQLTSDRP